MLRNHHFIFIEADAGIVGPQVILWGEAGWWPKKSSMRFVRTASGEIKAGTQYRQKVRLLFGPSWDVKVTKLIPGREIERTFLSGMFEGKEWVTSEGRFNGTRVDYTMQYEVKGFLNRFLWKVIFKKLHDKNIKLILEALKRFSEDKQKEAAVL